MSENCVKWIYYSEYSGQPLYWTKWHVDLGDKTLCGLEVPEGDDWLLSIDHDFGEITCKRCLAGLEAIDKRSKSAQIDNEIKILIENIPPMSYGVFTLEEIKQACRYDGRTIAAALKRLGYGHISSNKTYRQVK